MKKFMEALEEQRDFEKKQKKLHDKHSIEDDNVIVVEKSNMLKFSVRSIFAVVRIIAVCIILILAVTGLLCIIYPETRIPLQNILQNTLHQVNVLTSDSDEYVEAEVMRVVDGDTIEVNIDGESYKVRMIGVDTPESVASEEYLDKTGKENTSEGRTASEYTKQLLEAYGYVFLQKDVSEVDRYGRLLRYVWFDIPDDNLDIYEIRTKMLNAALLDAGYAKVSIYEPNNKYEQQFNEIAKSR